MSLNRVLCVTFHEELCNTDKQLFWIVQNCSIVLLTYL